MQQILGPHRVLCHHLCEQHEPGGESCEALGFFPLNIFLVDDNETGSAWTFSVILGRFYNLSEDKPVTLFCRVKSHGLCLKTIQSYCECPSCVPWQVALVSSVGAGRWWWALFWTLALFAVDCNTWSDTDGLRTWEEFNGLFIEWLVTGFKITLESHSSLPSKNGCFFDKKHFYVCCF